MFLSLISLTILIYSRFAGVSGVIVTSIEPDSACKDVINVGSVITQIVGQPITNSNDFLEITRHLKGPITMMINNNPRSCIVGENSTLGLTVRDTKTGGLRLGIDVGDGLIYLFKQKDGSESSLQDIERIIDSRITNFDLINTEVKTVEASIQLLTDSEEEMYIGFLVSRGVIEGKLEQTIDFMNGEGEFTFNDETYEVTLNDDDSILINGSEYGTGQYFTLDQVKFQVENITMNSTRLSGIIFDDKDLSLVKETQLGSKPSRLTKQGGGYVFVISVLLSEDASKNFAKMTKGQEVVINPSTGESFLRNPLIISIDDEPVVNLPISGMDVGTEKRDLIIWEYESTLDQATNDMLRLLSIIKSKRLPTELSLIKTDTLKPERFFLDLFFYIPSIFLGGLLIFSFARHRRNGIFSFPLILIILGEITIILSILITPWLIVLFLLFGIGFSLINGEVHGWFGWLGIFLMIIMTVGIAMSKWVLDASALTGIVSTIVIISILGISISEKIITKKIHVSGDYKHFSKVIWKLTTIVLVILSTLFFVGGYLRGFALTTFIGMMTCTTMSIPIYYDLVGRYVKK